MTVRRNVTLELSLDDLTRLLRYTNNSLSHLRRVTPKKGPAGNIRRQIIRDVERLHNELGIALANFLHDLNQEPV